MKKKGIRIYHILTSDYTALRNVCDQANTPTDITWDHEEQCWSLSVQFWAYTKIGLLSKAMVFEYYHLDESFWKEYSRALVKAIREL